MVELAHDIDDTAVASQRVFISYSRKDVEAVRLVQRGIAAAGIDVWRDQDELRVGDRWPARLGEAIAESDAIVLFWSADSSVSHFVEFEWTTAMALKKPILTVMLDPTRLHPSLSGINAVPGDTPILAVGPILDGLAAIAGRGEVDAAQTVRKTLGDIESGPAEDVSRQAKTLYAAEGLYEAPGFQGKLGSIVYHWIYRWLPWQVSRARRAIMAAGRREGDLERLLVNVRQTWFPGPDALREFDEAWIDVDLTLLPSAVDNTRRQLAPDDESLRPRPTEASALDLVDQHTSLLVLGEPGSGKSTLMRRILAEQLRRTESDPAAQVPVILELSSWSPWRRPFQRWVEDEVRNLYNVPRNLTRHWIETGCLLLLLDGLDEQPAKHRDDSLRSINRFVRDIGFYSKGPIVSCRTADYESIGEKLRLGAAVGIDPLSSELINRYLDSREDVGRLVREHIQGNPELTGLARSPMWLEVMSTVCQSPDVAKLIKTGAESHAVRARLLDGYATRMFTREGLDRPEERARVSSGLGWLATQMSALGKTLFLVEDLQPGWLRRPSRLAYFVAARSVVLTAAIAATVTAFLVWTNRAELLSHLTYALFGPIAGLISGVFGWMVYRSTKSTREASDRTRYLLAILYVVVSAVAGGAFVCLLITVLDPGSSAWDVLPFGLVMGVATALPYAVRNARLPRDRDIEAAEKPGWSWARAIASAKTGLITGPLLGIFLFGIYRLLVTDDDLTAYVIVLVGAILISAIAATALSFVAGGFSPQIIPVQSKTRPNEGTKLSIRNSVIPALGGFVVACVIFVLSGSPLPGYDEIAVRSAGFATLVFLMMGGIEVIHHYTLRLFMAVTKAPLRFVRLVRAAERLAFMRRVGSGYMFRHAFLQEYFADGAGAWAKSAPPE